MIQPQNYVDGVDLTHVDHKNPRVVEIAGVGPVSPRKASFFARVRALFGKGDRKLRPRSVLEAMANYKPAVEDNQVYSHFLTQIRDKDGNLKFSAEYRHNLTTDTATGFTNRRDWQSKLMGGGFAPFATATGALTACTATIATNSGASFPTAGQGLSGMMVVVGANSSGTGSVVWGTILSNTGTALTVDKWYAGGTWATGTTPNATGQYVILPGNCPAMYLAVTSDAVAPSSADTTLASEATTNGFARALATYAHTAAATTYTQQVVFTASGSLTVNKECVAGSAVASSGVMPFESAEPSPPVLISGDTLTQTVTITIN